MKRFGLLLCFLIIVIIPLSNGISAKEQSEKRSKNESLPEITTNTDKWSVLPKVKGTIDIDGDLDEKNWEKAASLSGFQTPFYKDKVDDVKAKLMYDDNNLYIGVTYDDKEDTLANMEVLLSTNSAGDEYYRLPININDFDTNFINDWGPVVSEVENSEISINKDRDLVTAEIAISLDSLDISEIELGEEWRLNILTQHKLDTRPMSSWVPIQKSSIHYTGDDSANAYANITDEGRAASIYMGEIPENGNVSESIQSWNPEHLSLQYDDFNNKRITFKRKDMNPKKTTVYARWKSPSGKWESIAVQDIKKSKEMLTMSIEHPDPLDDGLYQLQLLIDREGKKPRHTIVSFDRNSLMEAGDKIYSHSNTDEKKNNIKYEEPTEEVEKLLELIPERTGFNFNGLPDRPDLAPQNLFSWNIDNPWELTSKHSDLSFPNEKYAEDQVLTVKNKKGETVEYPYYEDDNNKKYFASAHIWQKQKEYVLEELVDLAERDPLGAARLIYRFSEVYEGWVPTNDHLWQNKPVDPSSGPPYHWWGGKWYRWAAAELFNFTPVIEAYDIVQDTNAFELLSEEKGEDVEQKIIADMFEPTIEFYHTFPILYHNMEDNNALSLIKLGQALDDSKYIHEAVEWAENFVMNTYLFDGFFQETSISYHDQSTDGINTVMDALNGWSDSEEYISPRSGVRLKNLDMEDKFPVLKKANEIKRTLVYPNGRVLPTQDTWASEIPSDPMLDKGSLLLPASGISRMQRDDSQLNLTFQPKYGHHHFDPLNLTLFSHDQELLPDIGYTHTLHRKWTESTLAHNTVVIDSEDMNVTDESKHGGNIDVFAPQNSNIQVTRASQESAYEQTEDYIREPWLIQFPDSEKDEGYVLDLFRVSGGDRHEYTLQGDANHDAEFESDLSLDDYGPYLLPEGVEVEEPETEEDKGSAEGHYYGYINVRDVKKTDIEDEQYELTLNTHDSEEEKAKMQITGLVDSEDYELFLGESPSLRATRLEGKSKDNNDEAVKYSMPKMVLRKDGEDLNSKFITVMEPYENEENPKIDNIEELNIDKGHEDDIAVKVTYGDTTDIILSSMDSDAPLVVDDMELKGKMGLIRLKEDKVVDLLLVGGTSLIKDNVEVTGDESISGSIDQVLRTDDGEETNAFVTNADIPNDMNQNYITITHPDSKKHGYKIKDIKKEEENTIIEIEDMDPGFTIDGEEKSSMKFYPFTEWEGTTTFQVDNLEEYQP